MANRLVDLDEDGILVRELASGMCGDVRKLIASRFPAAALAQLDKVRSNPLLRESPIWGFVAYENDEAACFQASIPRAVYWGARRFVCAVGGMTCARKSASPVAVLKVVDAAHKQSVQQKISFGNTMCRATIRMNRMLNICGKGPASMEILRFAVIHPFRFARYMLMRKILKRSVRYDFPETVPLRTFEIKTRHGVLVRDTRIAGNGFDEFWHEYVKDNQGVVCSRTEEELVWMFDERMRSGKCVLLSLRQDKIVMGFIVLESWGAGVGIARWRVLDLIALHNDLELIEVMLRGAKKFLRRSTPAMSLELIGFPTFAQGVLRRCLPFTQKLPNNFFSFATSDQALEQDLYSGKSWFFGPYDGDMCM